MVHTMILLKAFLILLCSTFSVGQFTPGCSFYGGQCVYNVKLGQVNSCDAVASHSTTSSATGQPSGSCSCTDVLAVKTDINSLKAAVAQLKAAVNELNSQLNLAKDNLTQVNNQLQTATQTNDHLQAVMQSKETLLNMTKTDLVNLMQNASAEITHLRDQLLAENHQLTQCQTTLNPSASTHTAAVNMDYTEVYCSFQDSRLCGFVQDTHDNGEWRHEHDHTTTTTGPVADHTHGTPYGYYMAMIAKQTTSSSSSVKEVRLISPALSPADNYCIKFWYNMNGGDVQTLNVYAKVNGGLGYPVWTHHGNQGSAWHLAQFSLNREYTGGTFNIVFEATSIARSHSIYHSGSGYTTEYTNSNGDIAIDDFYAYNTTCDAIRQCPPGGHTVKFGTHSKCLVFETDPKTWYDASESCRKHSPKGHLMVVDSQVKQDEIVNIINSSIVLKAAGGSGFYINANDQATESVFQWTITGQPVSVNFTNWHPGQPNDVGSNQDCVLLEYPDASYEWGDMDCRQKRPYICEIDI